jgi:hypothetical protein
MESNTQVSTIRVRVDACGHVLLCQILNIIASRGPDSGGAYSVLKAPRHSCWKAGHVIGRGVRWAGLTGGEILSAHGYRDELKCWCRLLLSLALFRLIIPPLHSEVV